MITVIMPQPAKKGRRRLENTLFPALNSLVTEYNVISTCTQLKKMDLRGKKLLFAVGLSEGGENIEYYKMLSFLRRKANFLEGVTAALIVDGNCQLYTKSVARHLGLAINSSGATIIGKGLVEATGNLQNFHVLADVSKTSWQGAYEQAVKQLILNLIGFEKENLRKTKLLVLHSSNRETSNSLMLWKQVETKLDCSKFEIKEIAIRDGQVMDCRGCSYDTCTHLGEKGQCFYGGIMVQHVYPAMIEADVVLLVCPNYNDALGANLTAYINRLTAIFRCHDFSKKEIRAIVVSGYSGGDIIAEQIMGAMCFNKSMILPPHFALLETAYEPLSVLNSSGIDERIEAFAKSMNGTLF